MPPKRSSTSDRGEERRAALLASLGELVEEHAYETISITAIAERAGLTRAAFYFYFPSKSAAVAELVAELTTDAVELPDGFFQDAGDPVAAVAQSLAAHVARYRTAPAKWAALVRATRTDPEIRAVFDRETAALADAVAARIDAGRAAGTIPDGPPARLTAELLLRLNEQATEQDLNAILTTGQPLPDLVQTITAIWTRTFYGDR